MDLFVQDELFKAAAVGNLGRLKRLAAENFDNVRVEDEDSWTALHVAAANGKTHICKYLAEKMKVDVNTQTEDGYTPLMLAVYNGHHSTANYLIEYGADVGKCCKLGYTALHAAANKGLKKLMQLLISRGADVNAISVVGTPLHHAIFNGKKEAVRILLANKSDGNAASNVFWTPVMISILFCHFECLSLLLKFGADPNIMSCGVSPLHLAASKTETEFVKLLLSFGANPNIVNVFGETPLEQAASESNRECVRLLFPVTSSISSIPEWSINGIMSYVTSAKAMEQRALKVKTNLKLAKQKGAVALEKNDYMAATFCYLEAFFIDSRDPIVLSNLSLCCARRGLRCSALIFAKDCVQLNPDWAEAHYREGIAWMLFKKYSRAVGALHHSLKLYPENDEARMAFKEALEADYEALVAERIAAMSLIGIF